MKKFEITYTMKKTFTIPDTATDEEYDAAGITILDPGWVANDGYFLRNSKEYIDEDLANKLFLGVCVRHFDDSRECKDNGCRKCCHSCI